MKILAIAGEDSFTKTLTSERADVLISCGDMADQVILRTAQAAQCSRIFASFRDGHFIPSVNDFLGAEGLYAGGPEARRSAEH